MNILTIVVTYNRKELLNECLEALVNQTIAPTKILVIDNSSTDGTIDWFLSSQYSQNPIFIYERLETNTGGAGGFSFGMEYAANNHYDWCWIMDDDALPEYDALEKLIDNPLDSSNIYGSIAINGKHTAWKTTIFTANGAINTQNANDIPDLANVSFLPFLGLLISTNLIKKIGPPDKGFFIAGDDLEYCLRARAIGSKIYVVGKSKINHPKAETHTLIFLGCKIETLKITPWKNYYNTRNKIIIAKKYYGYRLITETLPGITIRLIVHLLFEPKKLSYFHSVFAGTLDGLIGIKGRRHDWWRISL